MHKSGSKLDPNNFRGISLINSMCKINTSSNNRLKHCCDDTDIITYSRAGYSTPDHASYAQQLFIKERWKVVWSLYHVY